MEKKLRIKRTGPHDGLSMTRLFDDEVRPVASGKPAAANPQLVREQVGGEWYEYTPLGKFVVSAPAVCRGRPTFKYTRIEVSGVLERLGAGHAIADLIADSEGRLSPEAIAEAAGLAAKALTRQAPAQAGAA
jgi:uncharacterized protein (DUF433 family)